MSIGSLPRFDLNVFVPCVPVGQPKPHFGNGRTYIPDNGYRDMKDAIVYEVSQEYDGQPQTLAFFVRVLALFPRTANIKWKTQPMPRVHKLKKPDVDNMVKPILDALTGLIWEDDNCVCKLTLEKMIVSGEYNKETDKFLMEPTGLEIEIRGLTGGV